MNKTADSFSTRMKRYEDAASQILVSRMPVIIRVDGKNFSKLTRKWCNKPFDKHFIQCMEAAALHLCKDAQNVRMAYFQSDEISILMTDYKTLNTYPWFDNKVQKIASVTAGLATGAFMDAFRFKFMMTENTCDVPVGVIPSFDARCFNLPREEVANYFVWRQRDAERNSVSMAAYENFPHKELEGVNRKQKMDMLMLRKGINWNDYDTVFKRGACIVKVQEPHEGVMRSRWSTDWEIPIFAQQRDYVERYVREEERPAV